MALTFQELKREKFGKITTQRWSDDTDIPQLNDAEKINKNFEKFILGLKEDRERIFNGLDIHDQQVEHLQAHLKNLDQLINQRPNDRNPHELLMAMINDIALFPDIYTHQEEMTEFYHLIDKNDFHAYYTSIQRNGPFKTHGAVMIGSSQLQRGVCFSAAGEQRRGAVKLPLEFRQKLISRLPQQTLNNELIKRFGSIDEIVNKLNEPDNLYDTYTLYNLVKTLTPDLLDEYLKIQFNVKDYNKQFELWGKPRSSLQKQDTHVFNTQFPTFLQEQSDAMRRGIGHLHHGLSRKVAIREQTQTPASTVLKRWIHLEAYKKSTDERRVLKYQTEPHVWHFNTNAMAPKSGNCNTISAHLLGSNPETASIFNIGANKGAQLEVPVRTPEGPSFRDARTGNKYDNMLFESHLAKLIIHNPLTYQNAVLKVNLKIKEFIDGLNEAQKAYLIIQVKNHFNEFDPLQQDVIQFMDQKLASTDPKDLYRSILFHKVFFEEIFTKKITTNFKDRLTYYKMRPAHIFNDKDRGKTSSKGQLEYHNGIGGMRLHDVGDLKLHEDSFNIDTYGVPASSLTLFIDRDKRMQAERTTTDEVNPDKTSFKDQIINDDALFYSGASGSMTTTLPYIINSILEDDPSAQEDYMMASMAARSYAGHHSMFETVTPLKYMGSVCPDRLKDIRANDVDFYDKILTHRFKRDIHSPTDGLPSRYEQCIQDFESDKLITNQRLATSTEPTTTLNPDCNLKNLKNSVVQLIDKKLINLAKDKKSLKYVFLIELKNKLNHLDFNDMAQLPEVLTFLEKADQYKVNKHEGIRYFSRFKSTSGESITETRWVADQVKNFIQLVQKNEIAPAPSSELRGG